MDTMTTTRRRNNIFSTEPDTDSIEAMLERSDDYSSNQNNTSGNKSSDAEKKNKKFRIRVTGKIPFQSTYECTFLTTEQLGAYVNQLFRSVYFDYEGCSIIPSTQVNSTSTISVSLIFRPGTQFDINVTMGAKMAALEQINLEVKNNKNVIERVKVLDQRINGKYLYQLTKEGKEGLIDYMIIPNKKENVNKFFKRMYHEVQSPAYMNGGRGVIKASIAGFDIRKIIEEVNGRTAEDGGSIVYSITPMRPIAGVNGTFMFNYGIQQQNTQQVSNNWLYQIIAVPVEQVFELGRRTGEFITGEMNIITK